MQIIAVTSQKGGVGKTTLSMNLAIAAALDGVPTKVFDVDRQASAARYYDRRLENGHSDQPETLSLQIARLPQELRKAKDAGYQLAIIDTPPNVDVDAGHIAKAGDMILIPVKPSSIDLEAVVNSIELVNFAGRPGTVILNTTKPFGTMTNDARGIVTENFKFPVAPVEIGDRTAFVHAATLGQGVMEYEPSGKAAKEISALWKWVKKELKTIKAAENGQTKEAPNG